MKIYSSLGNVVLLFCVSFCLASEVGSTESGTVDGNLVIEETPTQITTKDGSIYTKESEKLFNKEREEFFIVLEGTEERVLTREAFRAKDFDPDARDE